MNVEKRKLKELTIDIWKLHCYSCRTSYTNSSDFATHHHHDTSKGRQAKIYQQPQQKSKEPAETTPQFVNCLNKENEINVTCHSCSTRFNSLHSFLAHLYTKNVNNNFNCKDNSEPSHEPHSQLKSNESHLNNNNTNDSFDSSPSVQHVLSPLHTNKRQRLQSPSQPDNDNSNVDNIMEIQGGGKETVVFKEEEQDEGSPSDLDFFPELDDNILESESESDMELVSTEFKCKFPCCSESFKIRSDLRTHYQTHFSVVIVDSNNEKENSSTDTKETKTKLKYLCQLCSKTFCSKSILREHHRNFHSGLDKKYKCKNCPKSFSQKAVYKRHLTTHIPPEKRPFKCTFPGCTKSYSVPSFLKMHSKVHTKTKTGNWTLDSNSHQNVNDNQSSTKSTREQKSKVKYECETCQKTFVTQSILRDHRLNFHSEKSKKDFLCTQCGKCFLQRSVFKRHMHSHINAKDRPFKCHYPGCSSSFVIQSFLKTHEQTHLGLHPRGSNTIYQCSESECTASFKTASGLQHHKEKVHEGITPLFKCRWSHCAQIFEDKSQLYHHNKTEHQEDLEKEKANARFICEYEGCSKRYTRHIDLKIHKTTHGPPTYECSVPSCGKKFKLKNSLLSHIRNHSAKYDKLCHDCGKIFKSNYQLKYHIKATHTGQRDFKCTVDNCPRAFITASKLHRHIREFHDGVKSYKCQLCPNAQFKNKVSLNRHLKKLHPEEDEEEEEAGGSTENESEVEEEEGVQDEGEEVEETIVLDFDLNNES